MAAGHRLDQNPRRRFKGKVRGGRVIGCSCGWMTFGGALPQLLRAHAAHVVEANRPPTVDELRARVAELRVRVAELAAG